MKNSTNLYPRQPKPGIKQLGKLDKLARERRFLVAARHDAMLHIGEVFARHPAKTGRIRLVEFINDYPLVRAFARIYMNIHCELMWIDNEEVVMFLRQPNRDNEIVRS